MRMNYDSAARASLDGTCGGSRLVAGGSVGRTAVAVKLFNGSFQKSEALVQTSK